MKREWRVRWKREGAMSMRRQHFQTEAAARRCADRQLTAHVDLQEWGQEGIPWEHAPKPLTWGPVVDSREVGEWTL